MSANHSLRNSTLLWAAALTLLIRPVTVHARALSPAPVQDHAETSARHDAGNQSDKSGMTPAQDQQQDREQEKRDREQEKKDRDRERDQERVERLEELYDDGREALDDEKYEKAREKFEELAKANGPQTDAAL